MQTQISEALNNVKKKFAAKKAQLFPQKKKFNVTAEQKIHLKLVNALTKITKLIDTQPEVMKSCEKAKFLVANAPLGTIPNSRKILETVVEQLEAVKDREPQIRYPLEYLKPLIEEYLSAGGHAKAS